MIKTTQWDENLVMHEGVAHKLDEMGLPELYALGESLRAAVAQIESQLDDGRIIRSDEDDAWRRRAMTARTIKQRQAEHIDKLLAVGPRPELSMNEALARVSGGGPRAARPGANTWTPGSAMVINASAVKPATDKQAAAAYFKMAARVVLHPSMFAAIEEQAERLQASEAGR